jgi:hypothetical protein
MTRARTPFRSLLLLSLLAAPLVSRPALAQTKTPAADLPAPEPEHGHPGFVFGVSVALSVPSGSATSAPGDTLSSTFAWQIPVTIDLGANIFPWLFLGAYGTIADGGPGSGIQPACWQDNCTQLSYRAGLVLEYRFLPGRRFEPWIGYGIGYDVSTQSTTAVNEFGYTEQRSFENFRGWDLAHARIGLDFLTDSFSAAGIFVDVSFGKFGNQYTQTGTAPGADRSLADPTMHEWITIGARWTFMP